MILINSSSGTSNIFGLSSFSSDFPFPFIVSVSGSKFSPSGKPSFATAEASCLPSAGPVTDVTSGSTGAASFGSSFSSAGASSCSSFFSFSSTCSSFPAEFISNLGVPVLKVAKFARVLCGVTTGIGSPMVFVSGFETCISFSFLGLVPSIFFT